ncbi:suppressor of fused domain protein, partial [Campylobacter sp.]|uniref:suppressor of fused domain protein n=1 Tax=Campylobacter sp. TaxID=205 RepID=UPI00270CF8DB|nr:suppressor of fused domain protein [Campylobacter sp.]
TIEEYKAKFNEDEAAPGWDAIDLSLNKIYGERKPRHYGTILKYMLGGKDPLDGISVYDCDDQDFHRHIVSYGMSSLYYDLQSVGGDFSGWGFEFTMRVKPFEMDPDADDSNKSEDGRNEPFWAMNLMQNLARYVYSSKKWFEEYHFIPTNGPIRSQTDTALTAIIFVPDLKLRTIDTPHGSVAFLQMFGITDTEYQWLLKDPTTKRVKELADVIAKDNPMFITDLARKISYV